MYIIDRNATTCIADVLCGVFRDDGDGAFRGEHYTVILQCGPIMTYFMRGASFVMIFEKPEVSFVSSCLEAPMVCAT